MQVGQFHRDEVYGAYDIMQVIFVPWFAFLVRAAAAVFTYPDNLQAGEKMLCHTERRN